MCSLQRNPGVFVVFLRESSDILSEPPPTKRKGYTPETLSPKGYDAPSGIGFPRVRRCSVGIESFREYAAPSYPLRVLLIGRVYYLSRHDPNDKQKGMIYMATIVSVNTNNTLTVDWQDGGVNCRHILPYQAGKPPTGHRVTCGDVPDSCTPTTATGNVSLVQKFGRCLLRSQCAPGNYCCPYLKTCLPNDGTQLDANWVKKYDRERYEMIYGSDRPCKQNYCDICKRHQPKAPMGLCSGVSVGTHGEKKIQTVAKPTYKVAAFDLEHAMCHCQEKFLKMWEAGQWVENIGGKPTCPTDPGGGHPPKNMTETAQPEKEGAEGSHHMGPDDKVSTTTSTTTTTIPKEELLTAGGYKIGDDFHLDDRWFMDQFKEFPKPDLTSDVISEKDVVKIPPPKVKVPEVEPGSPGHPTKIEEVGEPGRENATSIHAAVAATAQLTVSLTMDHIPEGKTGNEVIFKQVLQEGFATACGVETEKVIVREVNGDGGNPGGILSEQFQSSIHDYINYFHCLIRACMHYTV